VLRAKTQASDRHPIPFSTRTFIEVYVDDFKAILTAGCVYYAIATPPGAQILRFADKLCRTEAKNEKVTRLSFVDAVQAFLVGSFVFQAPMLVMWQVLDRWDSNWLPGTMAIFHGAGLLSYFVSCAAKARTAAKRIGVPASAMTATVVVDQVLLLVAGGIAGVAFLALSPWTENLGH
jgi:hypothetical protein